MPLTFRWNPEKAQANLRKHRVSFAEAVAAFMDPLSVTISDPDHSYDEDRFILLGISDRHRILVVVHTETGDSVQIISAREANRHERRQYEQG